MKIVLAGGTGQVGQVLRREFADAEVVVIARSEGVRWDGRTLGDWVRALEGADALINLAGRTVDCRYTPANRRAIMRSRLESTWALVEALKRCAVPPRVFLQSSTATIYADNYGPAWDERGVVGGDEAGVPDTWRFSIDVARRWEEAAAESPRPDRADAHRDGHVPGPRRRLRHLVRPGPARAGRPRRRRRAVRVLDPRRGLRPGDPAADRRRVLLRPGQPVLAEPAAVRGVHARAARRAGSGSPATRWMLEVGAFFMRTETELVLKSRRVVPGRLLDAGFEFAFPRVAGRRAGSRQSTRLSAATVASLETARTSSGTASRLTLRMSLNGLPSGAKKSS